MTELRWVLLLAALLILVVLFLWTRYRPRLTDRFRFSVRPPAAAPAPPPGSGAKSTAVAKTAAPAGKIVTIRMLSRRTAPFPAEELVLALRDAGLRHGRHGIFHYFPTAEEETPLFSVASLTEPGSFDLTRLRTDVYQGVSLFLELPATIEGVAAFDAMVNTGRAIAKRLDGNLVDEHGSTLSVQRERYLREEVMEFQHRQGRPA
jgi:cell division protein ZipA